MRSKTLLLAMAAAYIAGSAATSFADDGERLVRSVSSPPGIEESPEPEGEHAFIKLMNFRVPAQLASGELTEIVYNTIDGTPPSDGVYSQPVLTAKPLVNVYVYGPVIGFDDFSQSGFPGHGRRDSFGAVSLDDGETWKVTNLSNTADEEYFALTDTIPDPGVAACHDTTEAAAAVAKADVAVEGAPVITEASWEPVNDAFGKLEVEGTAEPRSRVDIEDEDGNLLFRTATDGNGEFDIERSVRVEDAPCKVVAVVDGVPSDPVPVVDTPAEDCGGGDCPQLDAYPGDVTNVFHAVASNKVLVAWQSKSCSAGFPGYTGGAISDTDALATYLGINNAADLYLQDLFVVAGSQLSTDYKEQEEFPGEYDGVGEVPYNCLWAARGVLRENPEVPGTTELVWFQAERLTSGRRDVNRVETSCTAGGGCAISWQEDPEGLRPGEGEGAGTGWAGATVNSQTDIWYSFIEWEDIDVVDVDGTPTVLADNILDTGRPIPYVPMMVPARLTNNARCQTDLVDEFDYCNGVSTEVLAYGIKNQCVGTIDIPLGQSGQLQPVCVVDANDDDSMNFGDLPNVANTGASRPRLNLQPRDSDGDGVTDDAWVIIVHEEDKGLGRFGFQNDVAWDGNLDNTGVFCGDPDASLDDNCIEADVGKNQWYISFALGGPDTSSALGDEFGMVNHLVAQQNQHNAPEVNWITGTFYPPMSTEQMWNFGDLNFQIFNNEIARRAALMTQSLSKALNTKEEEALMALPLFKEGIINQGGPADIMARRVAITIGGNGGDCDYDATGPGPGGVQPEITSAEWECETEDGVETCELEVEGTICVDGEKDPTQVVINIENATTGDFLCVAKVDEEYEFSTEFLLPSGEEGECELPLTSEPCSVVAISGPGNTAGDGQISDPVDVEGVDPETCVSEPVVEEG